jgi:hypothetical protein
VYVCMYIHVLMFKCCEKVCMYVCNVCNVRNVRTYVYIYEFVYVKRSCMSVCTIFVYKDVYMH